MLNRPSRRRHSRSGWAGTRGLSTLIAVATAGVLAVGASAASGAGGVSATLGGAGANTRVLTVTNGSSTAVTEFNMSVLGEPTNARPSPACTFKAALSPGEAFLTCAETINPGASVQVCFDGGSGAGNVILPLLEGPESVVSWSEVAAVSGCPLESGTATTGAGSQTPTSGASGPAGGGGAPPPSAGTTAKCVVPHLKGKKLAIAEKSLRQAHCAVGRIKKAKSRQVRKGSVISQSQAVGKTLPDGAKISLVISKGT
jgi:hypothetical protein